MKTSEAAQAAEDYAARALSELSDPFPDNESVARAHVLAAIAQVYATIYAGQIGYQG